MKDIRNIVCVVRESDRRAPALLAHTRALSASLQARLTLLDVLPELGRELHLLPHAPSTDAIAERRQHARREAIAELAASEGIADCTITVCEGTFFLEVIRNVLREQQDLLITTAGEGGALARFFSNDDLRLLRKCPCPIWLLRPDRPPTSRRILVAVDCGQEYSEERLAVNRELNLRLLRHALYLATGSHAEMHVVHAWSALSESLANTIMSDISQEEMAHFLDELQHMNEEAMQALLGELASTGHDAAVSFTSPTTHVIKGDPRQVVPALARKLDADLTVMGSMARTGVAGFFMGNTAEDIIDQLQCSLLALKPAGYLSPIDG